MRFPKKPEATPTIYAYESTHPQHKGMLKIGFTLRSAATRVAEQHPIVTPGDPTYKIVLEESAMRNDGSDFRDHDIHRYLDAQGKKHEAGEWYTCSLGEVRAAINAVRDRSAYELTRDQSFRMRPEQEEAVQKAADYFKRAIAEDGKVPHFLWNAKMRFGKTFATYELAKKLGWKRVLVLTFKPAVKRAWEDDLKSHTDFEGWQFLSRDGLSYEDADKNSPIVYFGSFQDNLGKNKAGGIKAVNEWLREFNWDCIVLDES